MYTVFIDKEEKGGIVKARFESFERAMAYALASGRYFVISRGPLIVVCYNVPHWEKIDIRALLREALNGRNGNAS